MTRRKRPRRIASRLTIYLVTGLLGLALLGSIGARPLVQAPPATKTVAKTTPAAHPMDEALQLLARSQKRFEKVKDYSCAMVKQERLGGELQRHIVELKVRSQPFSVYMKWQFPKKLTGQEACYVEGKHNGKMRVHPAGVLGALGWVTLDPNDARVKKNSNHTITHAGLANLLESFEKAYKDDKRYNKTKVRMGEYEFAKRRVIRVETVRMAKIVGVFTSFRNVLYFDKETLLPVRVERYDWPTKSNPKGELIEVYSYLNVKTNVGLPDATFNH